MQFYVITLDAQVNGHVNSLVDALAWKFLMSL